MKIQGWVLAGFLLLGVIYGCSDVSDVPTPPAATTQTVPPAFVPPPQTPNLEPTSSPVPGFQAPQMLEVLGSAEFGNQCPYGNYSPPNPVPVELWNCPLNLPKVELVTPLPSFILQADCKKKTLDVRSEDRTITATTWEVMPDGNFYFTLNAGIAKMKDDGVGHVNCAVPMVADMWGRIDCKDRDKATIHVETVWWLGRTMEENSDSHGPSPAGSPRPSNLPIPSPSESPQVWPSGTPYTYPTAEPTPSASPVSGNPNPSSSFGPTPFASLTPSTNPGPRIRSRLLSHSPPLPSNVADSTGGACYTPMGCYFHAITTVDQCQ